MSIIQTIKYNELILLDTVNKIIKVSILDNKPKKNEKIISSNKILIKT
jgi:hypothetical protein